MQQLDWKDSNSLEPKMAIQYCTFRKVSVISLNLSYFVNFQFQKSIHLVAAFSIHNLSCYLFMNVNGIVHVKYNFHSIPFMYQQAKPIMCKT
jgi:hypothetical protein